MFLQIFPFIFFSACFFSKTITMQLKGEQTGNLANLANP